MAGYFKKLVGNVYDGTHVANADLTNGLFVDLTGGKVRATTAAKDTVLRVRKKTKLWGKLALILDVVSVGTDEVWFTEGEWDINDSTEYDTADYKIKRDTLVKMKRPQPGEQLVMTVTEAVYNTLAEGDLAKPAADGTVNLGTRAVLITLQPDAETNVVAGAITGKLKVGAVDSALGDVTYQWKSNTSAAVAGASNVSDATTAELTIPTNLDAGTYYYFCVVTTEDATTTANSGFAKVVVAASGD